MSALLHRCRWIAVLLMLLAPPIVHAQSAAAQRTDSGLLDSLSAIERAWIQANPTVRVAGLREDPPMYSMALAGDIDGVVGAVLDLVALRTGLRFEPQVATSLAQIEDRLARREVEISVPVPPTEAIARLTKFTRAVAHFKTVLVARQDAQLDPGGALGGRTIAIEEDSPQRGFIATRYPSARVVTSSSIAEALAAVSGGSADAYIGIQARVSYQVEKLRLTNLEIRERLQSEPIGASLAVRADQPLLLSILDKAIASISPEEDQAVRRQWLPALVMLRERPAPIELTAAERDWITRHGELTVAYDKAFAPISMQGEGGAMVGLAADYLRLVQSRTGLRVRDELASSWSEALVATRTGKAHLLVASAPNSVRRQYLNFVGPYLRAPTAIVARRGEAGPGALADLSGRRLAILQRHFLVPTIASLFPTIELVETPSQESALDAVADGRADAAIGNLDVVMLLLQAKPSSPLMITNTVPGADSEIYFAVRAELPELTEILRKAMGSITEADHAQIRQKWLALRFEPKIPWDRLLLIGVPLIALLVVVPLLYSLRSRNRAMRRVAAVSDLYAALSEVGEAIARATDSATLIRNVSRIAVERGKLVCAWSGLVDPAGGELREVAMFSRAGPAAEAHPFAGGVPVDKTADTVLGGERVVNNDLTKYPAPRAFLSHWLKLRYRSAAGFPFRVHGRVVGGIAVFADSVGYFDEERVGLLEKFAVGVSYALERGAIESDRAKARDELELANRNLKLLSGRLIEAQETERRAIAQELHDELGQTLNAVKLTLHRLERSGAGGIDTSIEDALVTTDLAIGQVRAMQVALRPPQLDDLGLVPALRSMAERVARSAGLELAFIADAAIGRVDAQIETVCYRIAQEAITNTVRHAAAAHLRISLRREAESLELVVSDDGAGFVVGQVLAAARRGSIGIVGIRERAQLVGASVSIDSAPGEGTRVAARFPLDAPNAVELSA